MPHPEIDRILVNGKPRLLSVRVADGDCICAYPTAWTAAGYIGKVRTEICSMHLSNASRQGCMHVCIITSSFPLDPGDGRAAAGLFVRDFAVALAELGEQVTVLTPDKRGGPKTDVPGVKTHWFAWRGGDKPLAYLKPWCPLDALAIWSLLRNGRRVLRELAASEKFDHVLAMWAVPAGYLAMGLQKQTGTPFTTWCLGSDIWTYGERFGLRNIVRRVLQRSTHVYADGIELGHAATRLCGREVPFLPSSRQLDPTLAALPPGSKRSFNFLFVGRYAEVKGVDVLLARWLSRDRMRACICSVAVRWKASFETM